LAYTPGLKRKELVLVRKERKLPVQGEVRVRQGDSVTPDAVIAETRLPGTPYICNVTHELDIDEEEIEEYMLKKKGASVKKGEPIAEYKAFWGMINRVSLSPADGIIELVSKLSGQVVIREPPISLQIRAYIPGEVVKVLPSEGAVIQTSAAFIQGIFGVGGETFGELMIVSESDEVVTADKIGAQCSGKILVIKGSVRIEVIRRAVEVGAKGIICACISAKDLIEFVGYELGVVITGHENVGVTLIATEGFGERLKMSEKTFQLLKKFDGKQTSMNGATQIRAGVIRPEIIVPQKDIDSTRLREHGVEETEALGEGLKPGTAIRVISEPYFGALGQVIELVPELQKLETESSVRTLRAELDDGRRVVVPRANVEIVGE
jgi:hypothetical protein